MTRKLFHILANQWLVPLPDPYQKEREKVNRHVGKVQGDVYCALMVDVENTWKRGEIPRMPDVPTLSQLEEIAWRTYPK